MTEMRLDNLVALSQVGYMSPGGHEIKVEGAKVLRVRQPKPEEGSESSFVPRRTDQSLRPRVMRRVGPPKGKSKGAEFVDGPDNES